MGKTSIEWTGHTVNPLRAHLRSDPSKVGHYCEKVSPGCTFCYSSAFQRRRGLPAFSGTHGRNLGLVEPFLDVSKLEEVLRRRIPTTWFWCDMTDMFGSWVPMEHIAACNAIMACTPWHTHQVLTKRPGRALEFCRWLDKECRGFAHGEHGKLSECLEDIDDDLGERAWQALCDHEDRLRGGPPTKLGDAMAHHWPLPNVWFGISAEDQQRFDERWPLARQVPAAVRFVSYEPALGPVDFHFPGVLKRTKPEGFDGWPEKRQEEYVTTAARAEYIARTETPDWIIAGGESSRPRAKARPPHPDWFRSARDQCVAAGVPYFFKQWGEWGPWTPASAGRVTHVDSAGRTGEAENRVTAPMALVGKKAAGAELDGREWREMPHA